MKRRIILGVLIVLLGTAMFISTGIGGTAQLKSEVEVIVSTDRCTYVEGEDVKIFVIIRNISGKKLKVPFGPGSADYMIDDQYRWSDGKYFPLVVEDFILIEEGTRTWVFVHKSKDYYLSPGKHKIVGGVAGIEDSCMIKVIPMEDRKI